MTDEVFARTYGVELMCARSPEIRKRDLLQQSWYFPGAEPAIAGSTAAVLVTDLMSSSLEYRPRLDLFERTLRAVLEYVPCEAIHWQPASRIVDPGAWRDAFDGGDPAERFFAGGVNVRFFHVQVDDPATPESVMDTLGLGALGLPDLQCHFRGLDSGQMAAFLHRTAWYVLESGDVIEDGYTVAGIDAEARWLCRHEDSLVDPARVVLDINPGDPYAAGNRTD